MEDKKLTPEEVSKQNYINLKDAYKSLSDKYRALPEDQRNGAQGEKLKVKIKKFYDELKTTHSTVAGIQ